MRYFVVDAFADKLFQGNPAGVCVADGPLSEGLMQRIASENNLSETAFLARRDDGGYDLRWFTPLEEIDLCGHATLGSSFVVFNELEPDRQSVAFHTRSGVLRVEPGGIAGDGVSGAASRACPSGPHCTAAHRSAWGEPRGNMAVPRPAGIGEQPEGCGAACAGRGQDEAVADGQGRRDHCARRCGRPGFRVPVFRAGDGDRRRSGHGLVAQYAGAFLG
jgi:hypothetical protein